MDKDIAPARLIAGALLVYTALTILCFGDFIAQLDSALLGPPEDNLQDFWNSWYAAVGRRDGSGFFFTRAIKFPEGTSLHYHSFAYPQVYAVQLASALLGDDRLPTLLTLHNLTMLASFPLAGLGACLLVRHLTGSTLGGFVGGFIYAFNPSHVEHALHHLHVASIEFIPFFVLCYLVGLARRRVWWLLGAIAFYVLSALSSWYYLVYIGIFMCFHAVYLHYRPGPFPRHWAVAGPAFVLVTTSLLLSPWLVPMVTEATGDGVYASGIFSFPADLLAYVTFPPLHPLGTSTAPLFARFIGNEWEATAYLGLVNLALAVWLVRRHRHLNQSLPIYLLVGSSVFGILASGGFLYVAGYRTLPMPDIVLSLLPLIRNLRTPSRAVVFIYLFLAILVGLALRQLAATGASPGHRRRWLPVACGVLCVLDFLPVPSRIPVTRFACAPGLEIIRDDPEPGFGVLNLPTADYVSGNADMAEQACHRKPIVQGNTSRDTAFTLQDELEVRDLSAQAAQLRARNVKYIVMRLQDDTTHRWTPTSGRRDDYLRTYPSVYRDSRLAVLRVEGRAAAPGVPAGAR